MSFKLFELSETEIATVSTTRSQGFALGDVAVCKSNGVWGKFVYSRATAALIQGNVLRMPDFSGLNFRHTSNVYSATGSSGMTELKGDQGNAATAVTKDQYAGMPVAITVGTGIGQFGQIIGNEAATTSQKFNMYLGKPFGTALATTDDTQILPVDLCALTTAILDFPTGVANTTVASGSYFWRQVKGITNVIVTTATTIVSTVGIPLVPSTTAGEALFAASANTADLINPPFMHGLQKIGGANTYALCAVNFALEF